MKYFYILYKFLLGSMNTGQCEVFMSQRVIFVDSALQKLQKNRKTFIQVTMHPLSPPSGICDHVCIEAHST